MIRKLLVAVIAIILLIIVTLGIWATHFLKKSLPVIDGEVEMAGLENRVEVIRDEFGIPHIRAESDTDLYRALGFVSAQDRLWQMDLFRRVAHGRLAEIFGESSIDMDRRHRVFGFNRLGRELYENAREESRAICRAYTDGINRFIESSAGRLPFQFALLKYEPERWSPEDVYIVLMWQQWMVTFNWEGELAAVELIQKLGVEDALDLLTFAQSVGPTIIPESDRQYDASPSRIDDTVLPPEIDYSSIRFLASPQNDDEAQSSDTARLELPTQIYASNAWAVSGKQSASGMPILSNDPHIPHTLPSIWYMVHLSAPGIDDAAGITTLGVPMVVMGHTKHIAWSDTTTVADTQDLYVEKLNPDNPDEYLHKGKYRAFEIIKETIRYRGDGKMQSIDIEISLSEHGPIINDIANPRVGPETPLALKWAGSGGSDFVYGGHMLLKARGWDDFREALRPVATPVWNWVYADADGNIGYQLAGAIPIRKKGRGQLPVPGWIDDYEWDGHIPYDEMPRLFNPSTGYIVTANNRVTPDDYQYLISTKFAPRYRASRIEELINSKEKLSAPDMREIQMDLYSKRGERLRDYFVSACEKYPQPGPDFARAVELLREWNLETDVESVGASIFNESHATVARKIFGERLGPDLWKRVFRSFADLDDMIETESAARWFDDPATEAVETRDEALAAGVDAAARSLREFFKDGPDTWKWGGMHTLTFKHPLAVTDFMGRVLNVGPHPLGGAMSTINPGVYNFSLPDKPYEAWAGPSMRTVVDYADVNATRMVITLGQSEHPLSPHYSDQFEYWLKGDTIPIWKGAEVDAHAKGRLVLTPPK